MRGFIFSLPFVVALLAPAFAQPAAPAPDAFRSIELRGGGLVTVRYGPVRQVNVRKANPGRPLRVEGERLLIDRCGRTCPQGHHIEVEIVTPDLERLAVADGGLLRVEGGFPRQAAIAASVSSGGSIDLRALPVATMSAAISQGGRIFARPERELAAAVMDGGLVTYWGDAVLTSSVQRGGGVVRGDAAELHAPLAQLDPPLPTLPRLPVPPTPPAAPRIH